MKTLFGIVVLIAIIVGAYYYFGRTRQVPDEIILGDPVVYKNLIKINLPLPRSPVSSPVKVSGEARGNWYFEASFPVEVLDEDGTSLGIAPVQAKGDWMTTDYVPFEGSISFKQPKGKTGKLIFRKDNPSGIPENDDSISVPVEFE